MQGLWPYIQIARVDHWFKNVFMVLGIVLALFYEPEFWRMSSLGPVLLAILATCLIASSNYVLNEVLDAPMDRLHPVKKHRPAAAGKVNRSLALAQWILLGAVGIGLGFCINNMFGFAGLALWVMGTAYNVPPIRTKEIPYLDVLSESVNNPLRLLLGWHALVIDKVPPLSLLLSYWMIGAYFMATKRLAEYRHINDPVVAAGYRRSFKHYDADRLLVSMMFYITACAFFGGVFIVRNKLELILFVPFAAGFCAYYLKLGLMHDSPTQNPERLYKVRGFVAYAFLCLFLFTFLMFVRMEFLYEWFKVTPLKTQPLWHLGG